MARSKCPTNQQLQDFAAGNGSMAQMERIALHLERCDPCSDSMDSIEYAADDADELMVRIPSKFASEQSSHPEHSNKAGYTTYGSVNRDRIAPTVIGGDESHSDGDTVPDAAEFVDPAKPRFGDRYVLLEEIARGGMGVVHKARDLVLKRDVALKTIKSGELAGADEIRRFEVEAEAAAQLKHPNIVSIYEIGERDGQHYFTMELVDGQNLSALIREKAISPSLTAKYVRQIARGIHYAHRRGILHRDLKPSNVLVDGKHRVHVTDFGLAKRIETDSTLTATGQILGTPAYMPPEQASGQHDEVTIRSDVYSLGAILYELLTRRAPFEGESAIDVLMKVINDRPPDPRTLNPDVPLDLETICLKCLEKDRSRRYETAQDVADDLRSFLRGDPVVARPLGQIERSWRWMRRRPAIAFLGFTTLMASLTAIVSVAYLLADANQARDAAQLESERANRATDQFKAEARSANVASQEAREARQEMQTALQDAEQARRQADEALVRADAETARASAALNAERSSAATAELQTERFRRQLYVSSMNLVERAARDGNPSRIENLLNRFKPTDELADIRDFAWHYWHRQVDQRFPEIDLAGTCSVIRYTSDGSQFISGASNGTIRVHAAKDGRILQTMEHKATSANDTSFIFDLAISFDQRRLASLARHRRGISGKLWTIPAARLEQTQDKPDWMILNATDMLSPPIGGRVQIAKRHGDELVDRVVVSADGRFMATVHRPETQSIFIWNQVKGQRIARIDVESAVATMEFSTDGGSLAIGTVGGKFSLWDTSSGDGKWSIEAHRGAVQAAAFHSARSAVVTGSNDRTVKIWDAGTGGLIEQILHGTGVESLAVAPSETTLACGDRNGIRLYDLKNRESPVLARASDQISDVVFAGSERVIATTSTSVHISSLLDGTNTSIHNGGNIHSVSISADDRTIALTDRQAPFRVFRVSQGKYQSVREFGRPAGATEDYSRRSLLSGNSVAVSADGALVAYACPASGSAANTAPRNVQVRVHSIDARKEVWAETMAGTRASVLFSPVAPILALSSGAIWDVSSATKVCQLQCRPAGFRFTPDGSHIVTFGAAGRSAPVQLWNASTGKLVRNFQGDISGVDCIAVSPNGHTLATGGDRLTLWDIATAQELTVLEGHSKTIRSLSFSDDGRSLVSASADGTLRIWRAAPLEDAP